MAPRSPSTLRVVPAATQRTSPAFERYQRARAAVDAAQARYDRAAQVFRGYQNEEQAALAEQDDASAAHKAAVDAEMLGDGSGRAAAQKRCDAASDAADRAEQTVRQAQSTMAKLLGGVEDAKRELASALAAFLPEVDTVLAAECREAVDRAFRLMAHRIAIHQALGSGLTGQPARLGESGVAAIARKYGMQENLYPSAVAPFAGDIVAEVTRILGIEAPPAPRGGVKKPALATRAQVANQNMGTVLEVLDRCPTCRAAVREALKPALDAHNQRRAALRALLGGELVETDGESGVD